MTTIATERDALLRESLDVMDTCAVRGELAPAAVISVIDDICVGLHLPVDQLPDELRKLRIDAQARQKNHDVGYREDSVADTIVMCGLWAI